MRTMSVLAVRQWPGRLCARYGRRRGAALNRKLKAPVNPMLTREWDPQTA